jgi:protein SCO1/2
MKTALNPKHHKPQLPSAILPILAILALAAGLWFGLGAFETKLTNDPVVLHSATALSQPRPLQSFTLTNDERQPFNLDSLKKEWTFLAFGYTHCPDICPTTLTVFNQIDHQLKDQGSGDNAGFVFISVDPERDSLERLGPYIDYFNPEIVGATAPHQALRQLTDQLGILYQRVDQPGSSSSDYLVDHSASMLLVDPQGRLAAIFSAPHSPDLMARDFIRIANSANLVMENQQ